jgi:hypothetical protein
VSSTVNVVPVAGSAQSAVIGGLTNGTAYNFRVRAVNSANILGTLSTATAAVTPKAAVTSTVPLKPATPVATAGVAGGAVTASLAWTAPADGGSPLIEYTVRALRMNADGTVAGTTIFKQAATAARTMQFTTLAAGNYKFTVQARNANGLSPQSARSAQVAAR